MPSLLQWTFDCAASFFKSLTFKDAIGALWAPFSIFAGALAAFSFNNRRATRERIDKDVIEGNLALSVLMKFFIIKFSTRGITLTLTKAHQTRGLRSCRGRPR